VDQSLPKEVLLELIKNKHYLYILLIVGVYLLNWTVMLKLGLIISRSIVKTKKLIFPWAIIGAIYSLFAKLIISDYLYPFITVFFIFLFLKKISNLGAAKVFFSAVVSLLTGIFSFLLFGQPVLLSSRFNSLLFGPKGIIIGSFIENILPMFFVLIYRNSIVSQENQDKKIYINVTINIFLLFVVYCLFAIIFYLLATYHKSILWQVFISEVILIGITFFVFLRIRSVIKKEQQRSEENHSTYLLRTILSKQREYRNFFQVIRAMAERGANQNIVDYIDNILADMSLVEECNWVNPIFAAFQVAEQIKAKEKGVIISTRTKSALNQIKEPVKVYDIFKELLQYFVTYEERVLEDKHHIKVEVEETDQDYIFKITRKNNVEESMADFKTASFPLEKDRTLEQIAKRIRKLRGKVYFSYMEKELRGCLFKMAKAKPKDFPFPFNFGT